MKEVLATVACLSVVAVACSSSTASSSGGGNGGTSGSSCGQYKACSLVSASAVGQAFGASFSAGQEVDTSTTPSAAKAELEQCQFSGAGGWEATVMVRCCPCGDNDPQRSQSGFQTLGDAITTVSGVGDSAFWVAPGPDAGLLSTAYTLTVFVGADLNVSVIVLTPSGAPAPLAGAKQVAQSVLSAL